MVRLDYKKSLKHLADVGLTLILNVELLLRLNWLFWKIHNLIKQGASALMAFEAMCGVVDVVEMLINCLVYEGNG